MSLINYKILSLINKILLSSIKYTFCVHKSQSPGLSGSSVFTLAFNISGFSEWNLLHDTILAPSNSELAQEDLQICVLLSDCDMVILYC